MKILVVVCMLFMVSLAAAESVTVTIPTTDALVQKVTVSDSSTADAAVVDWYLRAVTPSGLLLTMELPPLSITTDITSAAYSLTIIAAADFAEPMRALEGALPRLFTPGVWPRATFRTAPAPAGSVLSTFTVVIEDEVQAIWTIRLNAAQTAALAGKTGVVELSMPDEDGLYVVWANIPASVMPTVTRPIDSAQGRP